VPGQRLGRLSLRLDAVYCAVVGLVVAVTSGLTADAVNLPTTVVAALGAAVTVWGGAVWWLTSALPLRTALRVVVPANVVAAAGLGAVSVTMASAVVVLTLVAVAVDVAAFATSQAVALRRLDPGRR
jgi:hypothetical protein